MADITTKFTTTELGTGLMGVLICGATDLRYLPFYGIAWAGVYKLRRAPWVEKTISARLAQMNYNADEGTPVAGRLLAGLPVHQAALAVVEKGEKTGQKDSKKASKPSGGVKGRVIGMLRELAADVSSDDSTEVVSADAGSSAKEVNDEAAQPVQKAQKADKKTKADDDAEWVREAAGTRQEGSREKVLTLRQVCKMLNTQVDDFPHVFVVGNSGAGKTTLVQLVVGTRPGKVVILDPKRPKGWEGPKWGGLPYVSRDKETSSYAPMVEALRAVVAEMDRRYRVQDEVTEPFEQLTVVLDEGKNSVQECEELAVLYKKIVSIGREVGVRLVLISTSDRAGVLGFNGEADSMDSFAWVQLGEFATRVQPSVKARGDERYYWAVVDTFGQWVPFENEKAFGLLPALALKPTKAWEGAKYNCQAVKKARVAVEEDAEALAALDAEPVKPGRPSGNGTRQMQALVNTAGEGDDEFLARMIEKYGNRSVNGSVNRSAERSADEVRSTSALTEVQTSPTSNAVNDTSVDPRTLAQKVRNLYEKVPATYQPKLANALRSFVQNGRKPTPAIKEVFGFDGGDRFYAIRDYLFAAAELADAVKLASGK